MRKRFFLLLFYFLLTLNSQAANWVEGYDKGPINASDVSVNCNLFSSLLSCADTNVQHALNTIDQFGLSSGPFILKNGGTTTSASIPFAQGISIGSTQPAYFGGTSDSTAVASILNSSTSLNITGLMPSVGVNGPDVNITAGAGVSSTGGDGGYPTLLGGAGNNNGDIIGSNGFARTGTTVSGFNPTNLITGIFSAGNNTADFAIGHDLYVANNATIVNGIGLDRKLANSGYALLGTGDSARIIGMDRSSTGAGADLTIQSSWAKSGSTNGNPGNLVLANGKGTGSGSGTVQVQVTGGGGSGTGDAAPTTIATFAKTTLTLVDPYNIVLGSTTGTDIGTATTQKLGFFGVTPVVQQANSTSLETVLSNYGLRPVGSAAPITVGTFSSTSSTDSTVHTAGGGKFSGGVGITKNVYVGGNIACDIAGCEILIKEGTNATMGTATLSAGTVVVSTTKVTANSRIFLTVDGGTLTNLGTPYVSARTAGTSFTVSSTNVLDASNVAWVIFDPA